MNYLFLILNGYFCSITSLSSEDLIIFLKVLLICFFSFSSAAFVQPVPVSFVLTVLVLGAVTSTELLPKENINQIKKREHSPGMGMTAERRLIFPNFPEGAQLSGPGLHVSHWLMSLHS